MSNSKKQVGLILLLYSIMNCINVNAQIYLKGYVCSYKGMLLFQPTKNDSNFFESLNPNLFLLGTIQDRNDNLEEALRNVGDSVNLCIQNKGISEIGKIYYFYAAVEIMFAIDNNGDIIFSDSPQLCFEKNMIQKCFGYITFLNQIRYLRCRDKYFQKEIQNYYINKGWGIPKFLTNERTEGYQFTPSQE